MWQLSLIRLAGGTKVRLVANTLIEAVTRCVETLYVTDRCDGNPLMLLITPCALISPQTGTPPSS
jgi:hypothetical protein